MTFGWLSDAAAIAIAFNPLLSLVGAIVAAMLLTRSRSTLATIASWAVLLAFWFVGDGLFSAGLAEEFSSASNQAALLALLAGGLASFGLGYVLPAWTGSFVGRRVTVGTGWLSAGVVAASASATVAALVGVIG